MVNLSFTIGEFLKLCKIAKVLVLLKKGDPLIVLIIDIYRYSPHPTDFLLILENLSYILYIYIYVNIYIYIYIEREIDIDIDIDMYI